MHLLANAGLKKPRWVYYLENLASLLVPRNRYQRSLPAIMRQINPSHQERIRARVNYYNRYDADFVIPSSVEPFRLNLLNDQRNYQLDLYRHLRRFPSHFRLRYALGDIFDMPTEPTIVKARPILGDQRNCILFNMNKVRHFVFIRDRIPFTEKNSMLVWRGNARQQQRQRFLERYYNHPKCDVGHANKRRVEGPWARPFLSIANQLQYKFILSLEGNDLATNLKWILSSNSLCFMPRPRMEGWFMEGQLEPGRHYVELRNDFEDLEEKIDYYTHRPEEALGIIRHAQSHVAQFRNSFIEDVISILVLEKYFYKSSQF